ncbi:hypothetical protein AB6D11_06265 [Vibrio splendidus]
MNFLTLTPLPLVPEKLFSFLQLRLMYSLTQTQCADMLGMSARTFKPLDLLPGCELSLLHRHAISSMVMTHRDARPQPKSYIVDTEQMNKISVSSYLHNETAILNIAPDTALSAHVQRALDAFHYLFSMASNLDQIDSSLSISTSHMPLEEKALSSLIIVPEVQGDRVSLILRTAQSLNPFVSYTFVNDSANGEESYSEPFFVLCVLKYAVELISRANAAMNESRTRLNRYDCKCLMRVFESHAKQTVSSIGTLG